MESHEEKWIFSFAITETQIQKNYTTYKITSIIIPKNTPEALSCITVKKRFREICKLYKEICRKACEAKIDLINVPKIKNGTYFKRFAPEVIEDRKNYIIKLLNFIGDNPVLYRSEVFVKFFETSLMPSCFETSHSIGEDKDVCEDELSIETFLTDDHEEMLFSTIEIGQVMTKTFSERLSSDPNTNILIKRLTQEKSLEKKVEDSRIEDIELRLKQLKDDSSFDYIYEAALKFTEAVENDAIGFYQKAFDSYKCGIDILLCGVKNDSDIERKKIVREKVTKYLARAEHIYNNLIVKENSNNSLILLSTKAVDKAFKEISVELERPLNYLSRFRIVSIVEGLQQVQDVTDKKVYMVKVLQKPYHIQESHTIFLPRESLYMVPLVAYCQTPTSIFLILKLISGGKLWDYIKNYQCPNKLPKPEPYRTIFPEPSTTLGDDFLCEPSKKLNNKIGTNNDISLIISELDVTENNNSNELDAKHLLNCSKKLLHSISSTLKKSKGTDVLTDCHSIASTNSSYNDIDEGSLSDILKEISQIDSNVSVKDSESTKRQDSPNNFHFFNGMRLLPTNSVRQYCAELVCAIDNLHLKEIICGDLSLDNILLGDKGQLQLTYFCQNETRLINPSAKAVTQFYVAPERPLSKLSDSWSLGIIMFELLTEQRFFSLHPGGLDYYAEVQLDDNEIDEDAKDILNKLIVINPNQRLCIDQIMKHKFFGSSVNWECLRQAGKLK